MDILLLKKGQLIQYIMLQVVIAAILRCKQSGQVIPYNFLISFLKLSCSVNLMLLNYEINLKRTYLEQELLVATTHFKAKFGELRASFRTEQSKDILKWLEAIRGGRPIILTGDLNGPPNEDFYSRYIDVLMTTKIATK